jgi:hypothetical protein
MFFLYSLSILHDLLLVVEAITDIDQNIAVGLYRISVWLPCHPKLHACSLNSEVDISAYHCIYIYIYIYGKILAVTFF